MDNSIAKPSKTKEIINKYGLKLQKSLGQNFLIDQNILNKIIEAAGIDGDELIIEIGPGIGSLTQYILKKLQQGKLIAIEKDRKLIKVLEDLFPREDNFELVNMDAMDVDWDQLISEKGLGNNKLKVLANLPYYITTPIIMKLLEGNLPMTRLVFMVQKEVAERMVAPPGKKDFGSLSVAVQFYSDPKIVAHVPPTVFIPQPEVYSTIISLEPFVESPYIVKDRKFFFKIVQAIFQQRRKNIKNALSKAAGINLNKDDVILSLEECKIDPRIRGEKLTIHKMVQLSNLIWNKIL